MLMSEADFAYAGPCFKRHAYIIVIIGPRGLRASCNVRLMRAATAVPVLSMT